jgi:peptidoglycan DL-endopeptidase CwlO
VDANGDGVADPYNPADAIFTAAHYLSASMGADKNIRRAIFAYNHADWYVNKVLAYANLFSGNTVANGTTGNAKKIIDTAYTFVGKVYYQLGGGRTEHDMNQNIFDCSSYVWRVFQLNGMTLGPLTDVNTKSLDWLGVEVPPSQIRSGDLIFFNTDGVDGHVGIYVGSGKFIGAQDSGCYVADVNWWANHYGLGHIRRILNG